MNRQYIEIAVGAVNNNLKLAFFKFFNSNRPKICVLVLFSEYLIRSYEIFIKTDVK